MRPGSLAAAVAAVVLLLTVAPAAAQQRPSGARDLETAASFGLRGLEDTDLVVALGDVDGDGRRDAALAEEDGGVVRVVLSSAEGAGTRSFRIAGTDVEELFGPRDAGDVNGDGLADVVVPTGSTFEEDRETGRAIVVLGRRRPQDVDLRRPEQRDLVVELPGSSAPVAAAGDVNGDGLGDLIAGGGFEGFIDPESADEDDEDERPAAWIVFGTREPRAVRDVRRLGAGGVRIDGARTDALFGLSVAAAGDLDADGLGDVVVGSPLTLPDDFERLGEDDLDREVLAEIQRGRAYVVFGRREPGAVDVTRRGVATRLSTRRGAGLGFVVAAGGDVNGDGIGDVAVTAPGIPLLLPFGQGANGSAFVVFGARSARPAELDVDALGERGFAITRADRTAATGLSLAAAGDQDGDGRGDLAVGELGGDLFALFEEDDTRAPGTVQLVFGAASNAPVDLAAPGDRVLALRGSGGDTAGVSLAGGSDLDADGRPELLVARPGTCRVGRLDEGDALGFELGADAPPEAGRGGPGDDVLTGGPVGDSLFGFGGADLLRGRDGHDCVFGGDGSDRLAGGRLGDAIFGELGDDAIEGDSGCDRIFGGDGADVIVAGPARVPLAEAMRAPIGARDRDEVQGGDGDDRITSGMDRDDLDGGRGDDRLRAGAADDEADGGGGADRVDGGAGGDRLTGGGAGDRVRGGGGDDVLEGGGEDGELEELLRFLDPDLPAPPRDDDVLDGGRGRDLVGGDGGRDVLLGRTGSDQLSGGSGLDRLFGGSGTDELDGGAGRDVLSGGAGRDVLRSVDRSRDVVRCGPGRDTAVVDRRDRVSGCEVVRRVRGPRARRGGSRRPLSRAAVARVASRLWD